MRFQTGVPAPPRAAAAPCLSRRWQRQRMHDTAVENGLVSLQPEAVTLMHRALRAHMHRLIVAAASADDGMERGGAPEAAAAPDGGEAPRPKRRKIGLR